VNKRLRAAGGWRIAVIYLFYLSISIASAAQWPTKPIRLLSPGQGGGSDIAARLIAQGLSARLGQQVVVDNRVGGVIIAGIASRAEPDGYTMLLTAGTLWVLPLMQEKPAYDPVKDFSRITLVGSSPMMLVVHPSVPAKSVRELIALAKSKPGQLNSATGPVGATPHLASELFKSMAGIDIVHIAYRSVGLAVIDLIGGRAQLMFPNAGAATPHVEAGRLRAVGIGSAKPSALAPGVPTIAEAGLPGYEAVATYGMFAPPKTPAALIKRLNEETIRVLNTAEVKEKLLTTSIEVIGSSPDGLLEQMKSDVSRLGKVIKAANIRVD
jgi:tripartite-type tricarboxylate transporter receptor subunit TctC